MRLDEQLHQSKTHEEGLDPNCPVCAKNPMFAKLTRLVTSLERRAKQNEKDVKNHAVFYPEESIRVDAVAGEQRRVIKVIKQIVKGER